MDFGVLIQYFFILLVLVALGFVVFVSVSVRKSRKLSDADLAKVHEKWKTISKYSRGDEERVFNDADKLADHVLKLLKFEGTLAEKLKAAKPRFGSSYQDMWWLHKKRNEIAHHIDAKVTPQEADRAVRILKTVLKKLGAL